MSAQRENNINFIPEIAEKDDKKDVSSNSGDIVVRKRICYQKSHCRKKETKPVK